MKPDESKKSSSEIVYSCYHSRTRDGEHFVPEHTLTFQIEGSLILNDGGKDYPSTKGLFRLIRRNQLLKFIKQPPPRGDFKSISIYLHQKTLKDFSLQHGVSANHSRRQRGVFEIKKNPVLEVYINSLVAYGEGGMLDDEALVATKISEGILLILRANPELKDILFDFTEPHKIDLEAFMNQNYHFNVNLDRFAYLTGRSLATFKRDFAETFQASPRKWLQQKRLQQAHYLISKKGKNPSDVYLDLGFEDLSHFSHAFKKEFGLPPKSLHIVRR